MDNWFTIEQIDRDTFSISEYKHWEETHCYLLCGEKCAILIDTGLGVSNIRKIVDSLTELPVMAVTTHVHWDHIGGHKYFDNIAVHEEEKDWLSVRFPIPLQKVLPGHHQLDIPVSLIADIEAGFAKLSRAGKLKQGNGLFEFRDFQIHI